jgi:hypothetical protein
MRTLTAAVLAALLSLLFVACGSSVNAGSDPCTVDGDCAPLSCCHATACGAAAKLGPCNVACTADCQAGTIDCGGGCFCNSGHCAAHLMN